MSVLLRRITNKGKCSSLVNAINEEMRYRILAFHYSNTTCGMRNYHASVWMKLYEWRKQLERK